MAGPEAGSLRAVLVSRPRAVRLFVSGAASHAGKSTLCLSLLSAALDAGGHPRIDASELAYIKPATQDERADALVRWCALRGVECVCGSNAPIVFYAGFTRAFLAGDAGTANDWLGRAAAAVDAIAVDKSLVVIDGVGFPAVGSVVGCSNAAVARAVTAPVVIVCKSGVGGAIDSVDLCATYFEAQRVPVLGTVLNDAPLEGFYSRDAVLTPLTHFFETHFASTRRRLYGVVPRLADLAGLRDAAAAEAAEQTDADFDALVRRAAAHVAHHADLAAIVASAAADPWNRVAPGPPRVAAAAAAPDDAALRRRVEATSAAQGAQTGAKRA
ncbi:P-loop containing nucleoside triphosphate hydrolase protein [Pelagophyceae sp. CCMP2097]|nr:P-loop containing nucleoside triphosphate hydrolase protein [Pelagophyceae sp. CCMP2097]